MPPPPLPLSPEPFGGLTAGVLVFCGVVVTAVLGFFGVRSSRVAPLQTALNDAFRSLTDELQADRVRLCAQISELEADLLIAETEVIRLRQEIRGHQQRETSLRRWAERSGLTPPG